MDMQTLDRVKAHLMESSEEYRRLVEQHGEYKKRIAELSSRHYLTDQEQIEEHHLKKLKLRVKDRMQEMIDQYVTQQVN